MSSPTNEFLTFSAIGNAEDVSKIIYNISPTLCPLTGRAAKGKAEAVLHEWQTDALAGASTSNAALEGDDTNSSFTFDAVTATVRPTNRCQILRKSVMVSGTQDAVRKYGRDKELAYQLVKKSKEWKRDLEAIVTSNNAVVTGGSTTARQMRAICGWYSTNTSRGTSGVTGTATTAATDGTQRALTESMVKTVLQSIYTAGGEPTVIMPGPFNKTVISGFTGNTTRTQDTTDGKLASAIDVYKSDFGTHQIVPNRFSRERDLHIIQPDLVALAWLRPMFTKDLASQGDNEKALIIGEVTLEMRNEAGCGVVADLTTS